MDAMDTVMKKIDKASRWYEPVGYSGRRQRGVADDSSQCSNDDAENDAVSTEPHIVWNEDDAFTLIKLFTIKTNSNEFRKKMDMWQCIAKEMAYDHFQPTAEQINNKWKTLRRKHAAEKERRRLGWFRTRFLLHIHCYNTTPLLGLSSDWIFMDAMDAITPPDRPEAIWLPHESPSIGLKPDQSYLNDNRTIISAPYVADARLTADDYDGPKVFEIEPQKTAPSPTPNIHWIDRDVFALIQAWKVERAKSYKSEMVMWECIANQISSVHFTPTAQQTWDKATSLRRKHDTVRQLYRRSGLC